MSYVSEADERFALVYDEAVRALDRQAAAVDELRSRAATVLGAAALVAGFLGTEVLKRHPKMNGWVLAACIAFGITALAAACVMFPWRWTFTTSARKVIKQYLDTDDGVSLDQFRWAMALDYESRYDSNQRVRWWLVIALEVAIVALGFEVIAWLIAL